MPGREGERLALRRPACVPYAAIQQILIAPLLLTASAEDSFYTVLFGVSRAIGVLSQVQPSSSGRGAAGRGPVGPLCSRMPASPNTSPCSLAGRLEPCAGPAHRAPQVAHRRRDHQAGVLSQAHWTGCPPQRHALAQPYCGMMHPSHAWHRHIPTLLAGCFPAFRLLPRRRPAPDTATAESCPGCALGGSSSSRQAAIQAPAGRLAILPSAGFLQLRPPSSCSSVWMGLAPGEGEFHSVAPH